MYTIEELVQLKQAGFTAEEIMTLSGTSKTEPLPKVEPLPETKQEVKPEPVPETIPTKTGTPDVPFQEMLDAFNKSMTEQIEAFKSAVQLSNINHDSNGYKTMSASDVVANIIRPNGQKGKE